MFSVFAKKNPYEQEARAVYAYCLEQIRKPCFYSDMGVPDTMDGRFDLLLLHVFFTIKDRDASFGQAVFDIMFADMDQMLREVGIGDMGIPKHMKRMMKGFNGRMHAYQRVLSGEENWGEALQRNVYGTVQSPDAQHIDLLVAYVEQELEGK